MIFFIQIFIFLILFYYHYFLQSRIHSLFFDLIPISFFAFIPLNFDKFLLGPCPCSRQEANRLLSSLTSFIFLRKCLAQNSYKYKVVILLISPIFLKLQSFYSVFPSLKLKSIFVALLSFPITNLD